MLLALTAYVSFAQTLVQRLYVLRADTTIFDQYSGMTHTCVLLYPDGRLRIEKTAQGTQGGDPDVRVYLDTLSEADLKTLQTVLDERKFAEIRTPAPHGGIVKDMDTLYVSVPREHVMQNISFNDAAERHPYEKALKPFQNSLKNLEKRKVPVAKSEKANNCEAPQVVYRSMLPTGSLPPPQEDNNSKPQH